MIHPFVIAGLTQLLWSLFQLHLKQGTYSVLTSILLKSVLTGYNLMFVSVLLFFMGWVIITYYNCGTIFQTGNCTYMPSRGNTVSSTMGRYVLLVTVGLTWAHSNYSLGCTGISFLLWTGSHSNWASYGRGQECIRTGSLSKSV